MSDPMDKYMCGDIAEWAPIIGDHAEKKARLVILNFDGWLEDHGLTILQLAEMEKTIAKAIRDESTSQRR